jgi:hypothetical protein
MTETEAIRRLMMDLRPQRFVVNAAEIRRRGGIVPEGTVDLKPGERVGVIVGRLCDDHHPLRRLNNRIGQCSDCGRRVQFRPDVRSGVLLCAWCAVARNEQGLGP